MSGTAPVDDEGRAEVVLSAERVDLAVHRLPRERVRLRREVHTHEVEVRVTVRREVLRVERLPVDDAAPGAGAAADQAPLELVLHEERPVVGVQAVPYERVRVTVDRVPLTTRVDTTASHEEVEVVTDPAAPDDSPAVPTGTSRPTTRTP
ncbi:DUF2382 domain-containing protein [Quadrisphaera sp. KR29]|uniref:DUF2382 domain-containing protein n=1 Tax=Quadrisphaera sp. KR29 TaxID=3461391 RepID=UPI0040449EFF